MPEKIDLGRFPVVLPDIKDAKASVLIPSNHELFMDYDKIDIIYYDAATKSYISFLDKLRQNATWKDPVANYSTMISMYPTPAAMTVVPCIDTGIIYSYIGNGVWIPISINALKNADEDTTGLMTSDFYNKMMDFYNLLNGSIRTQQVELADSIPNPTKQNTYYNKIFATSSRTLSISNGKLIIS